ncbi:transposase [Skermanella stibiiresistens SB22]|uniref:Transposase n=1 Tax=Skermanella stibiiresistens SB22 TaxID=1385369 RepID=W9H7B6_9PROT|nr:transposase [Skermanella stibiiresistens SB22]
MFWLDNAAWPVIEPHLPKNQPGARRVDDRRIISGIIHVPKSGCRWKDFRRVANRYDKLARNHEANLAIATIVAYCL